MNELKPFIIDESEYNDFKKFKIKSIKKEIKRLKLELEKYKS